MAVGKHHEQVNAVQPAVQLPKPRGAGLVRWIDYYRDDEKK